MFVFYWLGVLWGFLVTPWREFREGMAAQKSASTDRKLERIRDARRAAENRRKLTRDVHNADRAAPVASSDEPLPF